MEKKIIKKPFRIVLLLTLVFILVKNISLTLLIPDVSAYIEITVHLTILYLVVKNHRLTDWAIWLWATLYLFAYTAVKVGAKSLIILRGDAWEINSTRYYIDVFLVVLGIIIMILGDRLYKEEDDSSESSL